MIRAKRHIGIRIFFLALFLSYYADITFFTHSHIINGVTIVHSHFSYGSSSDNSGNPQRHSHSNLSLTLIAQASLWTAVLLQVPEIPHPFLTEEIRHLLLNRPAESQTAPEFFYLRGPPTI